MELLMLMLLSSLWAPTSGQEDVPTVTQVSCVFMETCLLPCSFESRENLLLIQWSKLKENLLVYAYKPEEDLVDKQDVSFKGRTSMFPEQISEGNASLQLSAVTVNDQGMYLCDVYTDMTGANEEINLRVESAFTAPSMEQKGDVLVCSSEGIYPQPNISWTPQSEPKTLLEQRENQLYSITSSITLDPRLPQQHTCNISTDSSWKSATYSLQHPMEMSTNVTIPCVDSMVPEKSLRWTFNYIQTIVSRSGTEVTYTADWRPYVAAVSESGSLSLKELSQDQQGVFVCELHTDHTTYISRTVLGHKEPSSSGLSGATKAVIGVMVFLILVVPVIIYIVLRRKKLKKENDVEEELEPLASYEPLSCIFCSNFMSSFTTFPVVLRPLWSSSCFLQF